MHRTELGVDHDPSREVGNLGTKEEFEGRIRRELGYLESSNEAAFGEVKAPVKVLVDRLLALKLSGQHITPDNVAEFRITMPLATDSKLAQPKVASAKDLPVEWTRMRQDLASRLNSMGLDYGTYLARDDKKAFPEIDPETEIIDIVPAAPFTRNNTGGTWTASYEVKKAE